MKSILMIVDCQKDFVEPTGALYVSGAEEIKGKLVKLINQRGDLYEEIIITQDWHDPEDYLKREEAKIFPPHCVQGTDGARVIVEVEEALQKNGSEEKRFTKPVFDIWAECSTFVDFVAEELDRDTVIHVCGVATNYCVYQAIKGFIAQGFKNIVMWTDAVKGIDDDTYKPRLEELKELGVVFASDDSED